MIALIAAVPVETDRFRSELSPLANNTWNGRIAGNQIVLAHTGVGKANAAATCTELILQQRPTAMILFGCGGAYLDSGLQIGDLAVASEEIFGDEGSLSQDGFLNLEQLDLPLDSTNGQRLYNRIPLDGALSEMAASSLSGFCASENRQLKSGPFVTVSTCSGTMASSLELEGRTGGICENMEGAAAALVCHRYGVPLIEVRGISNLVEDRNSSAWNLPAATGTAQNAVRFLLANWPEGFRV